MFALVLVLESKTYDTLDDSLCLKIIPASASGGQPVTVSRTVYQTRPDVAEVQTHKLNSCQVAGPMHSSPLTVFKLSPQCKICQMHLYADDMILYF